MSELLIRSIALLIDHKEDPSEFKSCLIKYSFSCSLQVISSSISISNFLLSQNICNFSSSSECFQSQFLDFQPSKMALKSLMTRFRFLVKYVLTICSLSSEKRISFRPKSCKVEDFLCFLEIKSIKIFLISSRDLTESL